MVQVKICGVNDEAAFDAAFEAGADWLGLVFYPPSPRHLLPERAAVLSARQQGGPGRVGLFVDPTDAALDQVLAALSLDALQITSATPARAAAIRSRTGVPVWLATAVASRADLPEQSSGIDRLLLDAKPQPGDTLPGGNARRFDWTVTQGWAAPLPWMLAGGLTPETVADAVRQSGATAVDVSSGVERARGVKDPGLIRAFVKAAHAA